MPGSALKAGARKLIFENSPRLLFVSLIFVIMISVVSGLTFRLPGSINMQDINARLASGEILSLGILYTDFRPVGALLAVLLLLLQPVLEVGFMSFCLKTHRISSTDFKDIFNGFLFFTKVMSIFLIMSVFIIMWSLLFIIPGIVVGYRYRLAFYILLDDPGKGALQCISESKLLMHGNKLDLLIIDISFLGWYVLDFAIFMLMPLPFTLPIVSIWLSPYVGLTRAAFYENRIASIAV